mmetsp:Transcript_24121/g.41539  ORF Transcript_24121/g.41539 Transcript_24121/m.41539 type:complete len:242 (-) Transcript_24121:111-836(-)
MRQKNVQQVGHHPADHQLSEKGPHFAGLLFFLCGCVLLSKFGRGASVLHLKNGFRTGLYVWITSQQPHIDCFHACSLQCNQPSISILVTSALGRVTPQFVCSQQEDIRSWLVVHHVLCRDHRVEHVQYAVVAQGLHHVGTIPGGRHCQRYLAVVFVSDSHNSVDLGSANLRNGDGRHFQLCFDDGVNVRFNFQMLRFADKNFKDVAHRNSCHRIESLFVEVQVVDLASLDPSFPKCRHRIN